MLISGKGNDHLEGDYDPTVLAGQYHGKDILAGARATTSWSAAPATTPPIPFVILPGKAGPNILPASKSRAHTGYRYPGTREKR
ncbi:MAG TPA: hypothetical protein VFF82_11880, partial [Rhodocyclaceae bacterium]|nr:hypothetical protein [Rhodocyclaceae bacterium]